MTQLASNTSASTPAVTPRRMAAILGIMLVVCVIVLLACSMVGPVGMSRLTLDVWKIRLIRLAVAATVGAGLACSGVALQGMLRNPLAEPYILGLSSGAGVGVLMGLAVGEWTGLPEWATSPMLALAGAVLTCGIVYGIAQRRGKLDPYVLLLSGVIVNAFNGAVMLSVYLFVKPYIISGFMMWAMGSLSSSIGSGVLIVSAVCVIGGWAILILRGAALNALGLGDEVARSSGVHVTWIRIETFLVVGLMTASAVALAGPVGFVGLIVPHICRLVTGPDHRVLGLVSGFVGAAFLMAADTFCRTAGSWLNIGDLPVGVITALSGGPFFIFLLRRHSKGGAA